MQRPVRCADVERSYDAYRFGDGILEVGGSEPALSDYLSSLYGDCRVQERGDARSPTVRCTVGPTEHRHVAQVGFEDPEPLDASDFVASVHSRGHHEWFGAADGRRSQTESADSRSPAITLCGSVALVDRRKPWHAPIAHLGINRLLHFQRDMLFFHAASLGIGGAGVLLFGDKCAGKTTTALFLAARGHDLMSDEVGAVRTRDHELLPFRRALSIRPGPLPRVVRERLGGGSCRRETLADGTTRIRARISSLFRVNESAATALKCAFFLSGFAGTPQARPLTAGTGHLAQLKPFGCSLYGASKRTVAFRLAALLSRTRVYALSLGPAQATAALVERLVEQG